MMLLPITMVLASDDTKTIGKTRVEAPIVMKTDKAYFAGCGVKGFHLIAEPKDGVHHMSVMCGLPAKGVTKYVFMRDTGI